MYSLLLVTHRNQRSETLRTVFVTLVNLILLSVTRLKELTAVGYPVPPIAFFKLQRYSKSHELQSGEYEGSSWPVMCSQRGSQVVRRRQVTALCTVGCRPIHQSNPSGIQNVLQHWLLSLQAISHCNKCSWYPLRVWISLLLNLVGSTNKVAFVLVQRRSLCNLSLVGGIESLMSRLQGRCAPGKFFYLAEICCGNRLKDTQHVFVRP